MLVHDVRKKKDFTTSFDFREQSGSDGALYRMFKSKLKSEIDPGLQVGVPGVVHGLYEAHQMFGKLVFSVELQ